MIEVITENPAMHAVGWALLQFVWQGALIAGVVAIALAVFVRRDPRLRYGIAVSGLAVMILLPIGTALDAYEGQQGRPSGIASEPGTAEETLGPVPLREDSFVSTSASAPSVEDSLLSGGNASLFASFPDLELLETWLGPLVMAWLLGVVILSMRTIGGWCVLRRLRRRGVPAGADTLDRVRGMARRLGLRRPVRILESTIEGVPAVIGWMRPVILLPASVAAGLSPEQLEAVIAHELAHVRRHDYLVNLFQTVVETLLFYHPGVWWVSGRIRIEREQCADDLAVTACGDPVLYAKALSELESVRGETALAMTATGGSLVDRVRRILGQPIRGDQRSAAWPATFAMTGLVLALIISAGDTAAVATPTVGMEPVEPEVQPESVQVEPTQPGVETAVTVEVTPQSSDRPEDDAVAQDNESESPEARLAFQGLPQPPADALPRITPVPVPPAAVLPGLVPAPEPFSSIQDLPPARVLVPQPFGQPTAQPFAQLNVQPFGEPLASIQGAGWLGATIVDGEDRGVVVNSVQDNSPAGEAGLEAGDLITEYNQTRVVGVVQLQRFVSETPVGRTVPVTIVRDGQEQGLEVTLAAQPSPFDRYSELLRPIVDGSRIISLWDRSPLGLQVEAMTPELREFFGADPNDGVLVTAIEDDSLTGAAGVRVGDVIVAVDGNRVDTPNGLRSLTRTVLASGNAVSLTVIRDRAERDLVVEPPEEVSPGINRGVSLQLGKYLAELHLYSSDRIQ